MMCQRQKPRDVAQDGFSEFENNDGERLQKVLAKTGLWLDVPALEWPDVRGQVGETPEGRTNTSEHVAIV